MPKGSPFWIFFGTVRLFSRNFFCFQRVPSFIFYFLNVTYKTGRASRVPIWIFLSLCDFFSKIFKSPQKVPPSGFLIFCNGMYVNKSRRVPPLTFFGTIQRFFERKKNKKFQDFLQKNVLRFLSLRYGADFRRSRLVNFNLQV